MQTRWKALVCPSIPKWTSNEIFSESSPGTNIMLWRCPRTIKISIRLAGNFSTGLATTKESSTQQTCRVMISIANRRQKALSGRFIDHQSSSDHFTRKVHIACRTFLERGVLLPRLSRKSAAVRLLTNILLTRWSAMAPSMTHPSSCQRKKATSLQWWTKSRTPWTKRLRSPSWGLRSTHASLAKRSSPSSGPINPMDSLPLVELAQSRPAPAPQWNALQENGRKALDLLESSHSSRFDPSLATKRPIGRTTSCHIRNITRRCIRLRGSYLRCSESN